MSRRLVTWITLGAVTCAALGGAAPLFAQPAQPAPTTPAPAQPAPTTPAPTGTDSERTGPDPANRPEAETHFNKGNALLEEEAWTAALAEFKRARELYPTRAAAKNVGLCLRKLQRYDEALDTFEQMLRDYPNMAADKKADAQREVSELRALVGTVDVQGAEPGAAISVDSSPRAEFPLIDPLRVSAGTHTILLFKEGFQSFSTTVDVAGGQTVKVEAKMPALEASGKLRVVEKDNKPMSVFVDGAQVGSTPWVGTVAVGDHVVILKGDGDLGTQPTNTTVKKDDLQVLTLAAESLESTVAIDVTPASGEIQIDSVPVGHGVWEGRLRAGAHVVTVRQDGYFPKKQEVSLERGQRQDVKLTMERDESADKWRKPAKITIDLTGGFAIAPTFGGDVSGGCADNCSGGVALGGLAMLHAGYQFSSGFSLGLAGGFYQGSSSVEGRSTTITPIGLSPGDSGTATDDLRLRGFLVGITGGWHFFEKFPLNLRLGAGALIGNARSLRSGTFTTRAGATYNAPQLASDATAAFVYIDPEATIGIRFGDHFEIGAGAQGVVLIAASVPTWGDGGPSSVNVDGDGLSNYSSTETLVGTTVLITPTLKARADF
ncbi:MAG: PEGA domain-containing protein [Polyangiaceae bacterium]